jgi:hypothetical protein
MKLTQKIVYILALYNLTSCKEIMKDSLHYTTEDVLNIKELIHRDDLESRGSYLYEGSAVASGYFADSKYYLLALKFDRISQIKI